MNGGNVLGTRTSSPTKLSPNSRYNMQHMNPLQTLLKTEPAQVDALSIVQVLTLCGDGRLTDNSQCSKDFREYLQIAKSDNLIKYLGSCLQDRIDAGPLNHAHRLWDEVRLG
jgi:hypothetical protein